MYVQIIACGCKNMVLSFKYFRLIVRLPRSLMLAYNRSESSGGCRYHDHYSSGQTVVARKNGSVCSDQ